MLIRSQLRTLPSLRHQIRHQRSRFHLLQQRPHVPLPRDVGNLLPRRTLRVRLALDTRPQMPARPLARITHLASRAQTTLRHHLRQRRRDLRPPTPRARVGTHQSCARGRRALGLRVDAAEPPSYGAGDEPIVPHPRRSRDPRPHAPA